jgi:electron transfer flavoprotein beta subunit
LPAVITVAKEINVPRMPSLRGLSKSKSAQIPTWTANDIAAPKETIGQAGSGTWVVKVFYPQRIQHAEMLNGEPEVQAKALIEKLKEAKMI